MVDESMSVEPSADNGNISVETEPVAPVEPVAETPIEPEPATPAEPELFELPDGTKVDAATLAREWKENFLPDYTKKAQALAAKETITKPTDPYADPNYTPSSYKEIEDRAVEKALRLIEEKETTRIEQQKAIEDAVSSQLTDIKKTDSALNENALFLHANKYGFRDLKQAHQNMKDMSEMAKNVQKKTAQDIAKRNDPVSASPGATGTRPEASQFATSRDYLNALKASGK